MKVFIQEVRKVYAFLKKDIKIELSYKLSFILTLLSTILFTLVFFFLARMLEGAKLPSLGVYSNSYFSFALVGMAFYSFFALCINLFSSKLRQEQLTGTLETIFLTPTRSITLLAGMSSLGIIQGLLGVLVFFCIGIFFLGANISISNVPVLVLLLALCTINFVSMGIIAASFILVFKRGNPINWLFQNISLLVGGVLYPVNVLPEKVQKISNLLPVTYALEALRKNLIPAASVKGLPEQTLPLAISAAILLPLCIGFFFFAVRIAKKHGTLSQY